jgi:hypothetical protein
MAETSGTPEPDSRARSPEKLSDAQLKEHIASVDLKCASPEQRAWSVYEYLKQSHFTTWDILCFCVNWLGVMTAVWPWMESPVKVLSGLVHRAHYFFNDKVLGEEKKLG